MAKNRLDYQAQLSRHSHDISGGYSASLCPGAIVPQYFDILGPGDSVYYRTHMFARLQDVVTAFLGEIDLHIDYFFVPLQMIYTPFGQVFAQTDDYISNVFQAMGSTDYFPNISPSQFNVDNLGFGDINFKFECQGKSFCRILDALDANPYYALNPSFYPSGYTPTSQDIDATLCEMPGVAPWAFCAYQAIYQRFYRNDELEKLAVGDYNIDSFWSTGYDVDFKYFKLHYALRPSDYFTTTRVSPIASAVNKLGTGLQFPQDGDNLTNLITKVNSFLTTNNSSYFEQMHGSGSGVSATSAFSAIGATGYVPSQGADYVLNANNIRALFAVDKFARIYGRADKTYDDQILAHFGIKIPHDVKHDLTHLKHYRLVIQSDPIFGTANTLDSAGTQFVGTIGQVGGQGQGTLDTDQEKFTAPVHGVFMAVAYILTKPRYFETFSKLHTALSRLSFPIPEYDKLGAQPLFAFETNPYYMQAPSGGVDWRSIRIGWQNRYQEWKKKYDRAGIVYSDPSNSHNPTASNIYQSWIISRPVFGKNGSLVIGNASHFMKAFAFFESPHSLDTIMVRPYDGDWNNAYYQSPHLIFQTDPFITEFKCFCKKVSWMSETGEPDL